MLSITVADLDKLRRQGAMNRLVYGCPRGTREKSAEAYSPSDVIASSIFLYTMGEVLDHHPDLDLRRLAAEVMGEYGGAAQIPDLQHFLHHGKIENLQIACARSLTAISGPVVEETLFDAMLNKKYSKDVRIACMRGVLDLLTGGWDFYLMDGGLVDLPPEYRSKFDLAKDSPDLARAVEVTVRAFR